MSSAVQRRSPSGFWPSMLQLDEVADDRGDVLAGDRPLVARQLDAHPAGDRVELLVELVAADPAEVVAAEVEEQALDQLAGVVAGGRIARAELLVDLDEGVLLGLGQVLVERRARRTDDRGPCRR